MQDGQQWPLQQRTEVIGDKKNPEGCRTVDDNQVKQPLRRQTEETVDEKNSEGHQTVNGNQV